MGYKMKHGNSAVPFKELGSSPAKQTSEEKALQSKIAKEFKLPVSKKSSMPKGFNVTGSKASTTPGYKDTKIAKTENLRSFQSKTPKGWDVTKKASTKTKVTPTIKPSTTKGIGTKGFSKTKLADAKKFLKSKVVKQKPHVKPKGILGPGTRPLHPKVIKDLAKVKNVATKVGRTAGKIAAPLGVAATLYDFYKSGQKHSGGKAVKGQKTGVVTPDPKKSIYNKPKKSIYTKKK